jgi:hypothetical protein
MPKRLKLGQPPKIKQKVIDEIVYALQTGASLKITAQYAGISYATLNNWTIRGRDEFERWQSARNALLAHATKLGYIPAKFPKTLIKECRIRREERIYFHFFKQIEGAKGIAALGWLKVIDTSAQMNADWAAFMLSKRYPEEYGSAAQRLQLAGDPNQPLQVEHQGSMDVNHSGEIKTAVNFNDLSSLIGILADVGALEPSGIPKAADDVDAPDDQVHPDETQP